MLRVRRYYKPIGQATWPIGQARAFCGWSTASQGTRG